MRVVAGGGVGLCKDQETSEHNCIHFSNHNSTYYLYIMTIFGSPSHPHPILLYLYICVHNL